MTSRASAPELSIGELAQRTGVAEATLRMWEARHGFPAPRRLPGGHRRYVAEDVDAVLAVRRARDAGLSLARAIERARDRRAKPRGSVFCALRERFGELQVEMLDRQALLWLTWALEDELGARAPRPLLFACFQRERFYRRSEARWRDLARSARAAIVLADFERPRSPRGWPVEIAVADHDPILREWVVICDAPEISACLVAREQPAAAREQPAARGGARRFETICSLEPGVARESARAFREIASDAMTPPPRALDELAAELAEPPAPSGAQHLRAAVSIAARVALYARRSERSAG